MSTTPATWRHLPGCFGCGADNPASLGIHLEGAGERAHASVTFDRRQLGGPDLVHGGALLTLVDEVMGSVPGTGERRRVTASMEVRFRRPVALGRPLLADAEVVGREGRSFHVRATVRYQDDPPDEVRVEATARFVLIDREPEA